MSLFNLFFPKTIKFPDSKYNKNISVITYFPKPTLMVDGLVESGEIMAQIWKAGITRLLPKKFVPQKVLLLGLCGGSNAHLINHYYPNAQITAVEIDPFMVELGKKYFNLEKVKNMNIIIQDALDYANNLLDSDYFDLILVDCFEGQEIPKKLEALDFHQKLRDHSRFTLINRLWWFNYRKQTLNFLNSLTGRFFFIKTHTRSNLIISLV